MEVKSLFKNLFKSIKEEDYILANALYVSISIISFVDLNVPVAIKFHTSLLSF